MKQPPILDTINCAINGLIYALKTERNLKIHVVIAILVLLTCLWIDIDRSDLMFIFFSITLVLMAETFNTAVEAIVNLLTLSHHPLAKIAKDVSAGAVLVTTVNALAAGYLIILPAIKKPILSDVINKIKQQYTHAIVILIVLILIVVMIFKSMGGRGSFTRGGIVSGHAALAFAASTAILCITRNVLATSLAFMLALLVAQSRVEAKFHRWLEVVLGALIGILASLVVFALFSNLKLIFL
ncbi:MAG: diacylglycerol kinase [Candidatus Eremiobacteraeota bacterium]|nr:diacylglycerol kinase [Candidatus Eremiobacteraeota bacterium]